MDITEIRQKFPILQDDYYNPLYFLDNASTTHKPESVINSQVDYYSHLNSNVNRGIYELAEKSTAAYEQARNQIAFFINAEPEEIIFTSGATEGMNGLVNSLFRSMILSQDSKILVSELEHNSSYLPLKINTSRELDFLKINSDFEADYSSINGEYDLAAFPHISNVTGTIFDPQKIRDKSKLIILDATQSLGHMKVDVKELDVDFLVFSGHKMYGPMGIGVVYGKRDILEKLKPFNYGGGMVKAVMKDSIEIFSEILKRFEAGTPNVAGAYGLASAVRFITDLNLEDINNHEKDLKSYLLSKLGEFQNIEIYHPKHSEGAGVISFNIQGIHPHDIASFLGDNHVCVRAGHHCAHIFHNDILNIPASVRASLAVYNDRDDIDVLIENLIKASEIFKR